ncbi:unnamed protein product [Arabidopsis lyrata]|nr:unnamed protein product [Arabidopsis lyrata]
MLDSVLRYYSRISLSSQRCRYAPKLVTTPYISILYPVGVGFHPYLETEPNIDRRNNSAYVLSTPLLRRLPNRLRRYSSPRDAARPPRVQVILSLHPSRFHLGYKPEATSPVFLSQLHPCSRANFARVPEPKSPRGVQFTSPRIQATQAPSPEPITPVTRGEVLSHPEAKSSE